MGHAVYGQAREDTKRLGHGCAGRLLSSSLSKHKDERREEEHDSDGSPPGSFTYLLRNNGWLSGLHFDAARRDHLWKKYVLAGDACSNRMVRCFSRSDCCF